MPIQHTPRRLAVQVDAVLADAVVTLADAINRLANRIAPDDVAIGGTLADALVTAAREMPDTNELAAAVSELTATLRARSGRPEEAR